MRYRQGTLYATGPREDGARDLRLALEQDYSVNVGDYNVSLEGIGPAGTFHLWMGVLLGEAMDDMELEPEADQMEKLGIMTTSLAARIVTEFWDNS